MAKRPSISSVLSLVGGAIQATAGQVAAGGTKKFFDDHRAELISVIQRA